MVEINIPPVEHYWPSIDEDNHPISELQVFHYGRPGLVADVKAVNVEVWASMIEATDTRS
jgi:hypothetical protein